MKAFSFLKISTVAALALASATANAAWPERPITIIVPWAAGGGTDATARIIGALLKEELKVPVNVVNRAGGNGVVGHQAIADAKPDGYTVGMATVEISMMHHMGMTKLTPADYTPLALMNFDPSAISVSATSPYKTLNELLTAIKDNPGKLKASGTAEGGIWQLALAGMLDSLKISPTAVQWVPSKGAAPGMLELVAGGVDLVPVSLPEARSMIDAGKARPLALMSDKKANLYPDLPTLQSLTGSTWTMGAWRGILAPKGLPADIAAKYEKALDKINHSKEYADFMNKQGYGIAYASGADFGTFMAKGDADMGAILTKLGMAK